jgi:hypothetical protein
MTSFLWTTQNRQEQEDAHKACWDVVVDYDYLFSLHSFRPEYPLSVFIISVLTGGSFAWLQSSVIPQSISTQAKYQVEKYPPVVSIKLGLNQTKSIRNNLYLFVIIKKSESKSAVYLVC